MVAEVSSAVMTVAASIDAAAPDHISEYLFFFNLPKAN